MLNLAGQLKYFITVNQPHAAQCAAVGISVFVGIEVNAEVSTACWEKRLKANPDRIEFCWIMGAEGSMGPSIHVPGSSGAWVPSWCRSAFYSLYRLELNKAEKPAPTPQAEAMR